MPEAGEARLWCIYRKLKVKGCEARHTYQSGVYDVVKWRCVGKLFTIPDIDDIWVYIF
jgi:hypothetical protein